MRALLDVNLLLALFDPEHGHHDRASVWWYRHQDQGWASCPITQNGFLRIISKPGYTNPVSFADAFANLGAQIALAGHEFWADDVSIADPKVFDHRRILGPGQLTDVYLLAIAVKNGGRFATFDQSIPIAAVRNARAHHLVVL